MTLELCNDGLLKKGLQLTKQKGFSIIEMLIISCIIFILVGVFGIFANFYLKKARETALRHELAALRMNLKLYIILHDKNPKILKDFFEIEKGNTDKKGNLVDPFGNIYIYNFKENRVYSGTSGYEKW